MKAILPYLPFVLFVLLVGVLLGVFAVFVPLVGWALAIILGVAFVLVVAADLIDTRRRDQELLNIISGEDEGEGS